MKKLTLSKESDCLIIDSRQCADILVLCRSLVYLVDVEGREVLLNKFGEGRLCRGIDEYPAFESVRNHKEAFLHLK